jgi:1-acyl-sn-glycerol-3-phosphate acyltransferase
LTLIRSYLFAAWLFFWTTVLGTAYLPLLVFPRRYMAACLRFWAHVMLFGLRWITGIKIEVRGRQFIPTGAALIAGKHMGMLDTIVPFVILPDVCFVMKRELTYIPLFGWHAMKATMVWIDRGAAAKALRKMVSDAQERFTHDRQLVIFPEGTRKAPGAEPDYKPGVAALYRDLSLPCALVATNSGQHWPAKGVERRPGTVIFEFLEPIPAGLRRGEFMKEMQARIEDATNALLAEGV